MISKPSPKLTSLQRAIERGKKDGLVVVRLNREICTNNNSGVFIELRRLALEKIFDSPWMEFPYLAITEDTLTFFLVSIPAGAHDKIVYRPKNV